MGRRRQNDLGLPPRVYPHHGGFIFKPAHGPAKMLEAKTVLDAVIEHGSLTKKGVITLAKPRGISIAALVDHYVAKELPKLSPITIEDYTPGLTAIKVALGDLDPAALRPKHLYAFIDGVTQADGRRNLFITLLRNLYKIAIKKGACDVNPARELQREAPGRRTRVPTLADLKVFTEEGGAWWSAYVTFKLLTGLRQNDLLALAPIALDAETMKVELSKSRRWSKDAQARVGRTTTYQMDAPLRATLEALYGLPRPQNVHFLFSTPRGRPYKAKNFRETFARVRARAVARGVAPFREHDIRATVATLDPAGAQQRLGHKHHSTTEIYIRQLEGEVVTTLDLESAQEAEKGRKTGGNIHQLPVPKAR